MNSRHHVRIWRRVGVGAGTAGLAVSIGLGAYFAADNSASPVAHRTTSAGSVTATPRTPTASTAGHGDSGAGAPTPQHNTSVHETQRGSLKAGGIIRMVWARSNLAGQGELQWVAGGIRRYRNADCTQRFQLGNEHKPARKANLLLCWRTSADRSVIAVLVDPDGKPSREKAVGELDKKWRAMG